LALNQYALQFATSDNATTGSGFFQLTGADAWLTVNNSSITDTGGTNVIDLSSSVLSANSVTLTGTGTSYLINVGALDTISVASTVLALVDYSSVDAAGATVTMGGDFVTSVVHPVATTLAGLIAAAVTPGIVYWDVVTIPATPTAAAYTDTYLVDANGTVVELVGTHVAPTVLAGNVVLGA
jgi:hypothetical protein